MVPTYRRPELLDRCLAALAAQTLPADEIEVIVVHDGPSEAARAMAEGWRARWRRDDGPRLTFLSPPHRGPAAARNAGWRAAAADIVAFTDDDTVPDRAWLERALIAFSDDVDAAWGRIVVPLGGDPTDYELDAARLSRAEFATANCFCRKRALERVGGFDERFEIAWREDSDLFFRLLASGVRVIHVPDAVVVHPVRPAPWGVSLGQQRKVQFDALLFKKHRALYRERIRERARWDYYAIVAALAGTAGALAAGATAAALTAAGLWGALTAWFCAARLRRTTKRWSHVVEMVVTSALIPPLAVFWRALGALRFAVVFL